MFQPTANKMSQPNLEAFSSAAGALYEGRRSMWHEICLEPSLLNGFCRRGRRRLLEIEQATSATVKLDRARGVLKVFGSPDAIQNVERHLETMKGPRKEVSRAAWAELMRTRTGQDDGHTAVALQQIQNQSGCRLHIERSKCEVRLFGPNAAVALADRLLDDFQKMCMERLVTCPNSTSLNLDILNEMAQVMCVTFRLEEDLIFILGLEEVVADAAEELARFLANPGAYFLPSSSRAAAKVASKVSMICNLDGSPTTASGELYESGSDLGADWSPSQAGHITSPAFEALSSPSTPCMAPCCGSPCGVQRPMVHGMGQTDLDGHHCHCCGAPRFCGHCGNQIWVTSTSGYPLMTSPVAQSQASPLMAQMKPQFAQPQPNYFQVCLPQGPQGMMPQMQAIPVGR
ncbi:unnamed protein product [Symbiodinium natans]|uniref:Uncharacterized protein n=1 Tax=Symbiodinium natans TaxID=878477 RepID=A0A812V396_9DINO|nr:unnamed protein product [Symbiodinium natans]